MMEALNKINTLNQNIPKTTKKVKAKLQLKTKSIQLDVKNHSK